MNSIDLQPELLRATAEVIHERFAKLEARYADRLEAIERSFADWRRDLSGEFAGMIAKLDPRPHLRGAYDRDGDYRACDRVCFNGAEWIARCDDPGDLPGDGWMLAAKRGRQGDRGEKGEIGERGMRGEKGEPGDQGATGADGLPGAPGSPGTPGEPGQRGEMGPRGEKGATGQPGANGAMIEAIHLSDTSLIVMRSDGVALECDLKPMLERFRESEGS